MTQPDDYDALFHAQLPLLDRLIAGVARRVGLRGDEVEDYASWARMRLWEHDYGILRKWRRESQLSTYLAVVLTNLGHEYRNKHRGRWRSSAAARRLGRLALMLERLLYLHGMHLDEAGEWLRTRGETTMSDRELAALRAQLPERLGPRPPVEDHPDLDGLADDGSTDARLLDEEVDATRQAAYHTLHAALARLTPLEQVIIRQYFLDGQTLADVARALGVEQKPLYRVKDGAIRMLKEYLLEAGMTRESLQGLLDGTLADLGPPGAGPARDDDGAAGKSGVPGPSKEEWDTTPMQADSRRRGTPSGGMPDE